jgi:hypothetical protein
VLPIAPSTYHRHRQRQADPARRSARAQHDDRLQRVYDEHHQVYGPRKVWKQLRREGIRAARCTIGIVGIAVEEHDEVAGVWVVCHEGIVAHRSLGPDV